MPTPSPLLDGRLIPAPRPHYRLRDGGLYFLISRRPAAQLDGEEREIWRALDGAATLDDLRARFGPAAEVAVRRFELGEPPRSLDPLDLYVDAARRRELSRRGGPWLARHREAPLLRILLRAAAGRWRQDLDLLRRAMPQARVEVHASPPALAEVRAHPDARVVARGVADGPIAWLGLCAGLAWRRPAPTLFVAGPDRLREARLLARAFPLSDTVVVPTMNLAAEAVRQALGGGSP